MRDHEPVQFLGAPRTQGQVALQRLREGVEQGPRIARSEVVLFGLPTLRDDLGQCRHRQDADFDGPDHQVVGGDVIDLSFPESGIPGVLGVPPVHELSDGVLGEPNATGEDSARAEGP